ncbi:MAG TPA: hypothetical protein VG942_09470 [Hyphomonadaceae bacterium]|nr:hypothetical protein [Hyphomonadaceae bacterium]
MKALLLASALLAACTLAPAATAQTPFARPAVDAILDAFKTHPLVAIDDNHGLAQELDFYSVLVRDPRFGKEVGNVVVEFGGASAQSIIDRYVAGEDVPYTELRKVWTDTVGWVPVIPSIGYINFFASVRAANRSLPADQRIHVWLGDPPIDWTKITGRADFLPIIRQRDDFPAALIKSEILAKGRKALLIYGGGHLFEYKKGAPSAKQHPGTEQAVRNLYADLRLDQPTFALLTPKAYADLEQVYGQELGNMRPMAYALGPLGSMTFSGADANGDDVFIATTSNSPIRIAIGLDAKGKVLRFNFDPLSIPIEIEAAYPNVVFHVTHYDGFAGKACTQRFEEQARAWPAPGLAMLRGTALERGFSGPGCGGLPKGLAPSDTPKEEVDLGYETADAILYFGPSGDLTVSPSLPDMYLDADYRREVLRRNDIVRRARFPVEPDMNTVTVVPQKWRPEQ